MKFSKGPQRVPIFAFLYSVAGAGKTSFASGAPSPYFVDVEGGSHAQNVDRGEPETWSELMTLTSDIANGVWSGTGPDHRLSKTVVFDTLTKIEEFLHQEFFWSKNTTIEEYDGGWGHGKGLALREFRKWFMLVEKIAKTKNVVILAHAKVKAFSDPKGLNYDRFIPSVDENIWQTVHKQVSFTLFAEREVTLRKTDDKKKVVGQGTGAHVLYTSGAPAYEAKNRSPFPLPAVLLLGWNEFEGAINNAPALKAELLEQITRQLKEIGDEAYSKTVNEYLEKNKESSARLVEVANRVAKRLEK